MREQNATDHGKSLEDVGDTGEHEEEISVWHSFEKTVGIELFTLTSMLYAASRVLTEV